MARPRKFSDDQILDAARDSVAVLGRDATVAQVADILGGPVGSIYHRFSSRDALMASLWVRSIRRFHVGLLAELAGDDPVEAATKAAVHIPKFCRENRSDAIAMTLYRQERLCVACPPGLEADVAGINVVVMAQINELCTRRYGRATPRRRELLDVAVRRCPYGLVRGYLVPEGDPIPAWIDDVVEASTRAIADLGDTGH